MWAASTRLHAVASRVYDLDGLVEARALMCLGFAKAVTLSGSGGDKDKPSISIFRVRTVLTDLDGS